MQSTALLDFFIFKMTLKISVSTIRWLRLRLTMTTFSIHAKHIKLAAVLFLISLAIYLNLSENELQVIHQGA